MDDLLELLREAELELHQPSVRRDRDRAAALLHESFFEIGRSGQTYDREAILNLMASASEERSGRVSSRDFAVAELAPGVAMLTYKSAVVNDNGEQERPSMRTSIWILTPSGWKVRFHQGTPTNSFNIPAE